MDPGEPEYSSLSVPPRCPAAAVPCWAGVATAAVAAHATAATAAIPISWRCILLLGFADRGVGEDRSYAPPERGVNMGWTKDQLDCWNPVDDDGVDASCDSPC